MNGFWLDGRDYNSIVLSSTLEDGAVATEYLSGAH